MNVFKIGLVCLPISHTNPALACSLSNQGPNFSSYDTGLADLRYQN